MYAIGCFPAVLTADSPAYLAVGFMAGYICIMEQTFHQISQHISLTLSKVVMLSSFHLINWRIEAFCRKILKAFRTAAIFVSTIRR